MPISRVQGLTYTRASNAKETKRIIPHLQQFSNLEQNIVGQATACRLLRNSPGDNRTIQVAQNIPRYSSHPKNLPCHPVENKTQEVALSNQPEKEGRLKTPKSQPGTPPFPGGKLAGRAYRPTKGGACNSAYACRDGKMLVVTKNRTKHVGGWHRQSALTFKL